MSTAVGKVKIATKELRTCNRKAMMIIATIMLSSVNVFFRLSIAERAGALALQLHELLVHGHVHVLVRLPELVQEQANLLAPSSFGPIE